MKKKVIMSILSIVLLIVAFIGMTSCKKESIDYYMVTFDSDGGSTIETQKVEKGEKATRPEDPSKEGYSFDDWYFGTERWSFIGYVVTEDITLSAHWNIMSYKVKLSMNDSKAGTLSGDGTYDYNKTVTIRAISNEGYTFSGWYSGLSLISNDKTYTFNMPAQDLYYEAKWIPQSDIPYKVKHYQQNIDNDKYTLYETENLFGMVNTYTSAQVKQYEGFISPTIIQKNIDGDGSTIIELYYNRKTFIVNLNSNISGAGNVTGSGTYKYGQNVTLNATENIGYNFSGWFDGDIEISKDKKLSISFISTNISYEARYEIVEEMQVFTFDSNATTCTITGIKDKELTSIIVPDIVTTINQGAFSGCKNLESITLPFVGDKRHTSNDKYQYPFGYIFGMTSSIGYDSCSQFYYGNSISELEHTTYYIPSSLKEVIITNCEYILYGAFSNCSSLERIAILSNLKSIEGSAFNGCGNLTNMVVPNGVLSIGEAAFYRCSSLANITIPKSVTSIGGHAFRECSSLANIVIPQGVSRIEGYTFNNCSNLADIVIPNSVTSIGDFAFSHCSSLKKIILPDSVTNIGINIFNCCISLESITLPFVGNKDKNGNIYPLGYMFCNSLFHEGTYKAGQNYSKSTKAIDTKYEIYYIPSTLKEVIITNGEYISCGFFENCNSLVSVKIPEGVKMIGDYAFKNCSSLVKVVIPNSVISIGYEAFFKCALTNITIPGNVTCVEKYAFQGCDSLATITLQEGITSIGYGAFNCNSLQYNEYENGLYLGNETNPYLELIKAKDTDITTCTINNNTKLIAGYTFYSCGSLASITIPNSVTSIGNDAFSGCSSLESINVEEGNKVYDSRDNCNAIIETNTRTLIAGCSKTIIPYGVTSIGDYAFSCSRGLTSITIPDSVTSIGDYAFYGCGLTSITIPNGVTSIGNDAFYVCSGLTNVTLSTSLTSIGDYAFSRCSSLTSITIPDSVTNIGDYAFYGCSGLTSVTIPDSVTSIEEFAFYECINLAKVYYGNVNDWNNIFIGAYNYSLTNATRYYYSETKPTEDGNYWHYVDGVVAEW